MSADSEKLYTAREVAAELGLGAAMLRRYASTYETVSGDAITLHRRDGRLFTETQVRVLTSVRSLVMTTNTDVETAVRQALEQPLTSAPVALAQSSALTADSLIQALTAAQTAANEPLLAELRGVREALERLEPTSQTEKLNSLETSETQHGPVVRFALWLERRLRRK